MQNHRLMKLNQRVDEIDSILDTLDHKDWDIAINLGNELDSIIDELSECPEKVDYEPNVFQFDQMKRSKPLIDIKYKNPAKVIQLFPKVLKD